LGTSPIDGDHQDY
jgi:hypothetical protein